MSRFVSQTLAVLVAVMITATSFTAVTSASPDTRIANATAVSALA